MPLSLLEQQNLRIIVEAFFGKQDTAHWEMNEELLDVVTKMIAASKSCSEAMDFVPRPGGYLSPDDVRKELARIAKRVILGGGASYWICENIVAWQWKQTADAAGQGAP
jgi:hypothetical protein